MQKPTSYLKNAALLTSTGLLLRALGMVFRVFVAARMGSEGMGVYQLVLSLYNVSIALATAGVSVAATRLAAEQKWDGSGAVRRVLRFGLSFGLLAAVVQGCLAGAAARWLLGDVRAALPLRILAPSLPFMAVAAAARGYFLARRNVLPNVRSQMLEQAVRIALVWALLQRFAGGSIHQLCACVVLGNTVSEAVSCLLMLYYFRRAKEPPLRLPGGQKRALDREIWAIMLPLEGNKSLSSALHAAENALVPACLTLYLGDRIRALSQFGALRGMALPVLFFPFSLLATLSTLLLPEITQAHSGGDRKRLAQLIDTTMLVTGGVSVLAGGLCTVHGEAIGQLLYQDREVGQYICMLGPVMPLMYLESMVDGILKGMGEQLATFRYSIVDSCLRIAGIFLLLPRFGIWGFIMLMAFSNFFTCSLNTLRMLTCAHIPNSWGRWLVWPCLCLVPALAAGRLAALGLQTAGTLVQTAGQAAAACLVYAVFWLPPNLTHKPGGGLALRGKAADKKISKISKKPVKNC